MKSSASYNSGSENNIRGGVERKMLESAFDNVIVPLAILDGKFNFIRVNRAFALYSGSPVQDFPGRNYFEFFPNPEKVGIFMSVINTRKPYTAWGKPEVRISPEGRTRYWDWSLTPVADEKGEINHLILSWADVTEREEARAERQAAYTELEYRVLQRTREFQESEESLRKTQETLDLAMESADMGAWAWDLVSGKMVWSKRRRELFGLDPEREVTIDTFLEAIVPEDRETVRRGIADALEKRTDYDLQMRIGLPDGGMRWLRSRGRGFYDENGRPVRLIGMAWDMSELRRNLEIIKESEERFRLATLAASEAVWDWDCATDRITFNEIYQQKYGRPDNGARHEWWLGHLHPEDRDEIRESFQAALQGSNDSWDGEYRFQTPDGSYAFIHDRAYLFRDESGKVRRIVGAMLDITGRKRIEDELKQRSEQLLAANRELESFTYNVSHDLRGPLRSLDGYTKMILQDYSDQFDPELKRRFNNILESTADMSDMIEALLRDHCSPRRKNMG